VRVINGAPLHVDEYPFTSPVGTFAPSAARLYDTGGNVWQWCEDWYTKDMNERAVLDKHPDLKDDGGGRKQHVVRGASWFVSEATYMLSSTRISGGSPNYRNANNGFRCVLVEEELAGSEKDAKESTESSAAGNQPLLRVQVKKYGVSALLPTDVFPDAKKLSDSDQSFLQGNSWTGQTTLTFSSVHAPLAKVYAECATEHSPQAPSKTVQYKIFKPTWFVVSGDLGPEADASIGFYTKGVKKDSSVVIMYFQWREDDFPFSQETFTAMSRGFDGN
jgi:hypothetical protein